MKIYAVKFKYDDGYENSDCICLVFADNENHAKATFQENIYTIFNRNDDLCEIEAVNEVKNPELIFLQRGTMWAIMNNESKVKMIW